jgi:hypothetical protein
MPSRRPASRQILSFELGDLVDVARRERGVFGRRRMLDIAVDADRAAVHDAGDAGARRRLDDRFHGGRVHRPVGLVGQARLPVHRRDVIDDLDIRRGGGDRRGVAKIAANQRDPRLFERRHRRALAADQGGHGVAPRHQRAPGAPR